MTSPNMRTAWVAALAGILALAGQVAWHAQPENTWAWPGWLLTVGALLVWLMGQQPNIQRSLQRIPIAALWFSLALVWEWLIAWGNEFKNMGGILRLSGLVKLARIEGKED